MSQQIHQIHTVDKDISEKIRLRSYIIGIFPQVQSGSSAKKAIKREQVIVNGKIGTSDSFINGGETIEFILQIPDNNRESILEVIYEDDHVLIVNKLPGVLSSGNSGHSVQSDLKGYDFNRIEDSLPYPLLVHRLDRATTGLLVAGKTYKAKQKLDLMMMERKIVKTYLAIVEGHLILKNRFINEPIDGQNAKSEILKHKRLLTKDPTTLVEIKLHTGRTHQIRKHFLKIGFPIVGDKMYNQGGLDFKTGLMLCAYSLEFDHPVKNSKVHCKSPVHKKFKKYF